MAPYHHTGANTPISTVEHFPFADKLNLILIVLFTIFLIFIKVFPLVEVGVCPVVTGVGAVMPGGRQPYPWWDYGVLYLPLPVPPLPARPHPPLRSDAGRGHGGTGHDAGGRAADAGRRCSTTGLDKISYNTENLLMHN